MEFSGIGPKDAGYVAKVFIEGKRRTGVIRSATLLGYQRGMSVPLVALYRCDYISKGGFHQTRDFHVALTKNDSGEWVAIGFERGGVFSGLPLTDNWREVFRP